MFDALLISKDERLITELQKISAVTQCSLEVNSKVNNSEVRSAGTVLIDAALNIVIEHPNVVIITNSQPGIDIWQKAVATSAKYVVFLPDAREWLLENLIPRKSNASQVIGVIGATGGLGSSLLASSIAALYATTGETVLTELPNYSGGLDVLWGIEENPGIRWSDLVNSSGRISTKDIIRTLPNTSGVSIMSCGSDDNNHLGAIDVVTEMATEAENLVIDLPNSADPNFKEFLKLSSDLVLVVGTTIRSTNAANQLITNFPEFVKAKLVVRIMPGTGLEPLSIAKTLGLTLIGEITHDQKITEHLEQGLNPAQIQSSGYRKTVNEVFSNLNDSYDSAVA